VVTERKNNRDLIKKLIPLELALEVKPTLTPVKLLIRKTSERSDSYCEKFMLIVDFLEDICLDLVAKSLSNSKSTFLLKSPERGAFVKKRRLEREFDPPSLPELTGRTPPRPSKVKY
jgi:hypothetical protein